MHPELLDRRAWTTDRTRHHDLRVDRSLLQAPPTPLGMATYPDRVRTSFSRSIHLSCTSSRVLPCSVRDLRDITRHARGLSIPCEQHNPVPLGLRWARCRRGLATDGGVGMPIADPSMTEIQKAVQAATGWATRPWRFPVSPIRCPSPWSQFSPPTAACRLPGPTSSAHLDEVLASGAARRARTGQVLPSRHG